MSELKKKLKSYAALSAGILIAGTKVVKSQIKYTDVNPDNKVRGNSFALDLDQDGNNDMVMAQYYYQSYYYDYVTMTTTYFAHNKVEAFNYGGSTVQFVNTGGGNFYGAQLDSGTTVGPVNSFTPFSFANLGSSTDSISDPSYAWRDKVVDKYLGVRLISTDTFYGWVRLDYDTASTSFTIKDYALEMTAKKPIVLRDASFVYDTAFTIGENPLNGAVVGTVKSKLVDTFRIVFGNTGNAFAIDNMGEITVNDSSAVDFETNPVFSLRVAGNSGFNEDTANVTINLTDFADEIPPVIANQTFTVNENAPNGTIVDTVIATDDSTLTYSIVAGNTGSTFAIDSNNGEIMVNDSTLLDFETTPSFSLTVNVNDGTYDRQATITINLINVFETGIKEISGGIRFSLYPNPVGDDRKVQISFPSLISTVKVNIMDISGKVISTYKNIKGNKVLDLSGLTAGVYFVRVDEGINVSVKKIILK